MNHQDLQQEVETYMLDYFNHHSNSNLVYHNLSHTKSGVSTFVVTIYDSPY